MKRQDDRTQDVRQQNTRCNAVGRRTIKHKITVRQKSVDGQKSDVSEVMVSQNACELRGDG